MVFRPRLRTRISYAVGTVLLGALLLGLVEQVWNPPEALGLLSVALVGYVAVRGYRMSVLVDASTVVIRGWTHSRTISRTAVRSMTELPALRWSDNLGHIRRSPLLMFVQWPSYGPFDDHLAGVLIDLACALGIANNSDVP